MFQNGPIRKVITKKVIFEDFSIFSPAAGHPGSTLRKILEDFFKKSQVRNSHYLFSSGNPLTENISNNDNVIISGRLVVILQ